MQRQTSPATGTIVWRPSGPARRSSRRIRRATDQPIAELDTQRTCAPKPVDGFNSEGLQPAELGWGAHEKWILDNARTFDDPAAPGIFLEQPGAETRVRTWCSSRGEQYGFLVTHNEELSIPDVFNVRGDDGSVVFRPTCRWPSEQHVLDEDEIVDGRDELSALLCGHERSAFWSGSQLTIEEARELAPFRNATGMQVTSAVLAGMVWAPERPEAGIVETDDMDPRRCREVQRPYLGAIAGYPTDRRPLTNRPSLFAEDVDPDHPWQFRNVLVH